MKKVKFPAAPPYFIMVCLALIYFTLASSLSFAATALEKKSEELKSVTKKIQGLSSNISQAKSQRQKLEGQLKVIELSISNLSNHLVRTKKNLHFEKNRLHHLNQQHIEYDQQLQQQKVMLGQQVRAAYMLGENQYLKLLLNQKDPQSLSRLLMYYRCINSTRIKIIKQINKTLDELAVNQAQIKIQSDRFAKAFEKEQSQNLNLQHRFKQRKSVLSKLDKKIETKSEKLQQLIINRADLQKLITQLKRKSHAEHFTLPNIALARMKGKLHWPTHGPITKNFGYVMDDSGTTYNGVFISAPMGQPVYAIYAGKVVFADWLRGVGLLVIIQHDKNFMTLYGHDHSLLVKTGEYVKQGQEIATVGKTGGYLNTGLFFQVRDDGRPLNPRSWCS